MSIESLLGVSTPKARPGHASFPVGEETSFPVGKETPFPVGGETPFPVGGETARAGGTGSSTW